MDWKDFFYFSRRERQGILLLIVFVAGIFLGKWIFAPAQPHALNPQGEPEETLGSTCNPSEKPEQPAYVPLSPNKQPTEHRSYYHPPKQEKPSRSPVAPPSWPKTEKYAEGTVIELNTADAPALMLIPGIGPSFAKRIIAYRNILGGYHRIEQLQEIYGMYEELYAKIIPYFKIDLQPIRPIPVNRASLDQLKAHPYVNFYQAKALVEIRKKKGKLSGIEDLQLLEEFTPEDWLRLSPYLEF